MRLRPGGCEPPAAAPVRRRDGAGRAGGSPGTARGAAVAAGPRDPVPEAAVFTGK